MDAVIIYPEIINVKENIGTTSDAANPVGTLNAKTSQLLQRWAVASETVRLSATTSRSGTSVYKTFHSLIGGRMRIKFAANMQSSGTNYAWNVGLIHGFGHGEVQLASGINTTPQNYSIDVDIAPDETFSIMASGSSGATAVLSNVYVCFDIASNQTPIANTLVD